MLLNARVTVFTVSELLRVNQQGGVKLTPTLPHANYSYAFFPKWELLVISQPLAVSVGLPRATELKFCIFHLVYLLKACMNLNGTEWLVEVDWKNFENDRKSFGTGLKTWQKNISLNDTFIHFSINSSDLYLSTKCLFNFLSNLYISLCLGKMFKVIAFTFLENVLNLCIFTYGNPPHTKLSPMLLSLPLRQR